MTDPVDPTTAVPATRPEPHRTVTPRPPAPLTVSTHILDTSIGRPAHGVTVRLATRSATEAPWQDHARGVTDTDGRCTNLPALPTGTIQARLVFEVEPHLRRTPDRPDGDQPDTPAAGDRAAFFPEVAVAFAVTPGEHYHVPLLLNPFGYCVYRGS